MKTQSLFLVAAVLLTFGLAPGCKSSQAGSKTPSASNERRTPDGGGKEKEQLDFLYVEANTQYIEGNPDEALKIFEQVLEKDPKHHASLYNIAKINLEKENFEAAVKFGKQALDLDPTNYWYYQVLEKAYEGSSDYAKALTVQESLVKQFPEDKNALYDLAQLYIRNRKFNESLEVYTRLEGLVGVNEDLLIRKHQLHLQQNDPEAAIAEIDKLIAFNPYDSRYYQMKYDVLVTIGEKDRAREVMQKMLEINPDDGFAMISMADYYRSIGEMEKSDEYLFKAFESPNVDRDAKIQILGGLYQVATRDESVRGRLKTLAGILYAEEPESALINGIQGDLYLLEEKSDSALYFYRKALAIDASNEQVWQEVLLIDSEQNDYENMRTDAETALEYFPNQVIFLYFFGVGAQQTDFYDEAIYAFEKIKKIEPDGELLMQAVISLGEIYHSEEQYKESDENFEIALELDPENPLTLNNYAYFLSLRNERLSDAAEMVKKALKKSPTSSAYLDTYGWILYLQNDLTGAEEWIKKAIDHGGIGEVYEHYGDVQMKLGNTQMAEEYWQKAKESGVPDLDINQKLREK